MLTAEGCAARRQRLWGALPAACDALIISDPSHLIYFAGYAPSPFVFRTAEAGALLILEPVQATLVADNLLTPFLERAFVENRHIPVWYEGKRSAPHRRGLLVKAALERLAAIRPKRIGLELASVPFGVVEGLRNASPAGQELTIIDLDPVIRPLRRAKDPDELATLCSSMRAGEAGQAAALAEVRPGMTELDVFLTVQRAAMQALCDQAIIYGDFVSGVRCAREQGGPPSGRTIARGDLCLVDFSVVVGGYRCDFTNTFAVGAAPSAHQRELFEACLAALRAGERYLSPSMPACEVDRAVRGEFATLGLDRYFTSHTGHGIGLGHPEPPYLVPESDDVLQVGDVVALEPGLYVEGVGGMRFERNYAITAEGYETLSNHELQIDAGAVASREDSK